MIKLMALAALAFNLTRAAGTLAGTFHAKATCATIRDHLINIPVRLARSARRLTLHLPRIVYVFQAMEAVRSAVEPAVWRTDWEAHHRRVGDLLEQHTEPGQHLGLLQTLSDHERTLIDRMLERRLDL